MCWGFFNDSTAAWTPVILLKRRLRYRCFLLWIFSKILRVVFFTLYCLIQPYTTFFLLVYLTEKHLSCILYQETFIKKICIKVCKNSFGNILIKLCGVSHTWWKESSLLLWKVDLVYFTTWVRHECDTNVTWTTGVRHECDTSATRTTRVPQ